MQATAKLSFTLAFVAALAGCPGKDEADTGGEAGTGDPTTGVTAPTETDSVDPTTSATTDDATSGGAGVGLCAATCEEPADCAAMGGSAADWACVAGFCEFVGVQEVPACDESTCPGASGRACALVHGDVVCTIPCTVGGTECDASLQTCTGEDDSGKSICSPRPCGGVPEGAPCTTPMLGQNGTCVGGTCSCTSDTECTITGQACDHQPGA